MRSDVVVVKFDLLEKFRKANSLSRFRLFSIIRVHPQTGKKLMDGETVSILTAARVAEAIGVEVENLIERWCDEGNANSAYHRADRSHEAE